MASQTMYLRVYSENTAFEKVYAPVIILGEEDAMRFNREHFVADSHNNINNRLLGGNYQYCGINEVLHPAQITQPRMARFLVTDDDFQSLTDRADVESWGVQTIIDGESILLLIGKLINPFPVFIAESQTQCWVINIIEYGVTLDLNSPVTFSYSSPYITPKTLSQVQGGGSWPFAFNELSNSQASDYYYRYVGKTSRGVTWSTARTNLQAFHTDNQSELLQGGWAFEPDLSVSSNARNLQVPSSYTVSAACEYDGYYDGQFDIAVTSGDLSSPYSTLVSDGLNAATVIIHTPVVGERSASGGTPTNESALNDLAYQMVEDYIEYITFQYDATFRGVVLPDDSTVQTNTQNIGCNVCWRFCADMIVTHIYSDPITVYEQYNLDYPAFIPDAAFDVSGKVNVYDQFMGYGIKEFYDSIRLSTELYTVRIGTIGDNQFGIADDNATEPMVAADCRAELNIGKLITRGSDSIATGYTVEIDDNYLSISNSSGTETFEAILESDIWKLGHFAGGSNWQFNYQISTDTLISFANNIDHACLSFAINGNDGITTTVAGLTFHLGILTGGSFSGGMSIGGAITGASVPGGVLFEDGSGDLAESDDIVFDTTAKTLTIGQPGTDDDHYFRNTKVGRITGVTEGSINGPYLIATGEGAEEESPPPPDPDPEPPPLGP